VGGLLFHSTRSHREAGLRWNVRRERVDGKEEDGRKENEGRQKLSALRGLGKKKGEGGRSKHKQRKPATKLKPTRSWAEEESRILHKRKKIGRANRGKTLMSGTVHR